MTWKALIRGRVFNMGRRVALFVSTCTTTKVTETCITHTFICARLVLLPPLSAACDEEKTDRRRARARGRRQYPGETQNQEDIAEWVGEEQDLCAFYADPTRFANLCLNEHVMPRPSTRPPSLSQSVEMILIIISKLLIQKDFPTDVTSSYSKWCTRVCVRTMNSRRKLRKLCLLSFSNCSFYTMNL